MNKPVFYIILFVLLPFSGAAQNLVPNPSFEDTIYCPSWINDYASCTFWNSATSASPDVFHSCVIGTGGVPFNDFGYQLPDHGEAYAGLITYASASSEENYREYLTVELLEPLQAGIEYNWCISASLMDNASYGSNNIGVSLTSNAVSSVTQENLTSVPVYGNHSSIVIDMENWSRLGGSFIANGNEKYVTIGNFFDDASTAVSWVQNNASIGEYAYYYIDNVYIGIGGCLQSEMIVPNVFTPDGDGVNDYFNTKDMGVENKSISVLNRWGEIVFESDEFNSSWDGTHRSKPCKEGTYYYIIRYKNLESNEDERKSGFVQLIR